ncbi:MAG: PilN domain-containing protein [Actinomycetota bacterium]|nr:PilN domain-containing protein [Actinomycetota bacterium]
MTVLTSESNLLGTTTGRLPRVNLMPPEVAEAKAMRRVQMALGAAGVASVAVVGALYMSASHSVSAANSDLAASKSKTTTLQGQVAKYKDVTATIDAANAAQAQLVTAMGDEIRYSQLLNDLSLTVPSTVWLKSLSYTSTAPGAAGTPASFAGAFPVGTLSVTGIGFSHDDVALWLEAIAGLRKTYANPYFANSTEALIGARPTVNFNSTAVVLSTAQSNRYKNSAGS